jgi:hypothetical protein
VQDATGYLEGAHPDNTARLRITNNGLFDNHVEFSLKSAELKAVEEAAAGAHSLLPWPPYDAACSAAVAKRAYSGWGLRLWDPLVLISHAGNVFPWVTARVYRTQLEHSSEKARDSWNRLVLNLTS